ncbi:zinc finger and SCAN domain-containing protein 22-like isoform X1 [Schistocerca piceifrons]|uniref:zinc finger and SCAN domain-containing protein 22-like isoform X1 n=1 Tax=Schistocerca piceifrons TaxID=274613 RepID=UPI001F5FAEAA|nr:zinc finger and SCAN domain-containing protein 22-like isoform X1 [Schistocerca piceifrons]
MVNIVSSVLQQDNVEDSMKNGVGTCQTEKHPLGQGEDRGFSWDSDEDGSQSTKDANGEGSYSDADGDADWDEEGSCPLVSGSPVTIRVEPEIMSADGEDFIWDPEEDVSPPHQSPTSSSGSGMSYGCGCCGQQFAHLRQLMEHMAQHAPPHSQAGAVAVSVSHQLSQATTSEQPRYTVTQPVQPPPLSALPVARPVIPRPAATVVPPQEFGFACVLCGKVFARQGHLAMHCRLGHGVQPSKGWGLKVAPSTFMQQVRAKDVERPFECQLCQKRFVRKHHLQAHLRSHSGIKPFNCPLCGKALSSKQSVGIHLRQHEPVPPVSRQHQPILPVPASRPQ